MIFLIFVVACLAGEPKFDATLVEKQIMSVQAAGRAEIVGQQLEANEALSQLHAWLQMELESIKERLLLMKGQSEKLMATTRKQREEQRKVNKENLDRLQADWSKSN